MPQVAFDKTKFTRGRVSELITGLTDEKVYQLACKEMKNVIALPQGGLAARCGTQRVDEAQTASGDCKLVPFTFSEDPTQSYILEFTDRRLRIFGYDSTTATHALISGILIKTPYDTADLKKIRPYQQADVIILVCGGTYTPRKLSRVAHSNWTLEVWNPAEKPWSQILDLRYYIYDTRPVRAAYNIDAATTTQMDYYFSSERGAEELRQGRMDRSIAWSYDSNYYSDTDDAFRNIIYEAISASIDGLLSFEVRGNITVEETGSYSFSLNHGKFAADLFIDGTLVTGRYGMSHNLLDPTAGTFQTSLASRASSISLGLGTHTFRARVWCGNTGRGFAVYWKKPGDASYSLIPATQFIKNPNRYGVDDAVLKYFELDSSGADVTIPPTNLTEFEAYFDEDSDGVTLGAESYWDDRIKFYSDQATFSADLIPPEVVDGDDHALEITGVITIPEDDQYEFSVDSNDGAHFVLYEDDPATATAEIASWYDNALGLQTVSGEYDHDGWNANANQQSGLVSLTAGVYGFRLRTWSTGVGCGIGLAWRRDDTEFVAIPHSAITANPGYYPRDIIEHQQRIFVDGGINNPGFVYSSRSLLPEDFTTGANADDGLAFRIASSQVDRLEWFEAKDRNLYMGCGDAIYVLQAEGGVLTPDNLDVSKYSETGSAYVDPLGLEESVLFIEQSGRGIRELTYQLSKDKAMAVNIDILADDLFTQGVKGLCRQSGQRAVFSFNLDELNKPRTVGLVWVWTDTGQLRALTYNALEQVYAWTEPILGGTSALVDSAAKIKGSGGEELWLSVKRTIDGATVRTIEKLNPALLHDLGKFHDGGGGYVNTITMSWLANETINAVGAIISGSTITLENISESSSEDLALDGSGEIALTGSNINRYHHIWAGYGLDRVVETLALDPHFSQGMTTIDMMKSFSEINLNLVDSAGVKVALAEDPTDTEPMDDNLVTTDRVQFRVLGWTTEAALRITAGTSMPITLIAVSGRLQVNTG